MHHNPIDLISELKVVGKYNHYISQVHMNNIVKQMSSDYGELIKQFKYKIKSYVNVRYEKYPEDEPTEILNHYTPIEIITNLTRIQLNDLDIMSDLYNEIQKREMEGSGWNLQGINYPKNFFHKTSALNGMTYTKFPIKITSILYIQNFDTYCFLWSILASIYPTDKGSQRVSKYKLYRNELNVTNIDFTNGMRIVDTPRFEKLNPTNRKCFKLNIKLKITNKSEILFPKTNICWLCDKTFRDMNDKVKHYCKLSDK